MSRTDGLYTAVQRQVVNQMLKLAASDDQRKIVRAFNFVLFNILCYQFNHFCTISSCLTLSDSLNILQFIERNRILNRHFCERRFLKYNVRREIVLFCYLFCEFFQHGKKLRIATRTS